MIIFIKVAQLLLSLTLLVFVHEFGHFAAAKLFGMRVRKFYLLFDFLFPLSNVLNFSLLKFKHKETTYGLGWFPLGGYVDIEGMIDETTDAKDLNKTPEPWEFRAKPAWQRLIVMLGGIIMNIITAIVIFTFYTKHYEKTYLPMSALTDGIYATDEGKKFGFETGDKLIQFNGKNLNKYEDFNVMKYALGGEVTVLRNEKTHTIILPGDMYKKLKSPLLTPLHEKIIIRDLAPSYKAQEGKSLIANDRIVSIDSTPIRNFLEMTDYLSNHKNKTVKAQVLRNNKVENIPLWIAKDGKIGVFINSLLDNDMYKTVPYTIGESFVKAVEQSFGVFFQQIIGFGKIFKGEIKAKEGLSGPIGMANMMPSEWNWMFFWHFTALISMALAFGNLLPIPALDGGHIVVLLWEMISGKPVSDKTQEMLQKIGTIIILLLMVFIFYNDIMRIFGK
jgi:regulator of sigma E protease